MFELGLNIGLAQFWCNYPNADVAVLGTSWQPFQNDPIALHTPKVLFCPPPRQSVHLRFTQGGIGIKISYMGWEEVPRSAEKNVQAKLSGSSKLQLRLQRMHQDVETD